VSWTVSVLEVSGVVITPAMSVAFGNTYQTSLCHSARSQKYVARNGGVGVVGSCSVTCMPSVGRGRLCQLLHHWQLRRCLPR
jgi:hypothetical protein